MSARSHLLLARDQSPRPAMNTERTIDTMAVVTPNCAMEMRSHTNSYKTLQNPETKKKRKYQIKNGLFAAEDVVNGDCDWTDGGSASRPYEHIRPNCTSNPK